MSVFEVLMIVCFGFAWPINLYNSVKSKSTKGKNVWFLLIIALAYVFGILHKLINSRDAAVYFYMLNAAMVAGDISLYFIHRQKEIRANKAEGYLQLI